MTHLTHHEAHSHNADHYYKAAVIIPSRGGAHLLHYPLEALRAQTEKDFQVIVVLDGDIDNSEAVLKKYAAEGGLNLSTIIFPENRGRVAALNAGHRAARTVLGRRLRMSAASTGPTNGRGRIAHDVRVLRRWIISIFMTRTVCVCRS